MGGAQYQTMLFIRALVATGNYEITYITKNVDADYKPDHYKIVRIKNSWNITRTGLFLDAVHLYKALARVRPDVIYQRVGSAYSGIAAYYARKNGSRFIWHISSDSNVIPFRFRTSRNILLQYVDKKLLEFGIKNADAIIAQTVEQAELLRRNYQCSPSAIVSNFHPLPTEEIWKTKPVEVMWIGNIKRLKQPEIFVRLAQELHHLSDVRFVIIGALQGSHRRLRRAMETLPNLRYLGARTQTEVNEMLARAAVLVNTSLWEGFPNTFIQAWMRKVPVVSLNVNPNSVLADTRIGFCSGSFDRLCDDVAMLIEDESLRDRMGEEAQTYAFENHSEKNIAKLIELIDKQCAREGAAEAGATRVSKT